MRVYFDANFFISGFSERPKDVFIIKEAADQVGIELWMTRQVFLELRWYLRREVEQIVQIDETLAKDIKSLMESTRRPESSLPQPNDMSLILAVMRAKNSRIVSSDLKLLNTVQDLHIETETLVGSAFVLELMESVENEELKKKLAAIRDRIYAEEVRYSIARREAYDPVARIRIIEEHALKVLRSVRRPAEVDKKLTKGQPLFVLDFLEDIKAGIPAMFDDFKDGRYESLAREIDTIQNEIERLLIVSTLTEDSATHQALVEHASELTLFLYFLEMICHLYRGTREGIQDALSISEEAFRLLMFAAIDNNELKASVFFVRIVLALIREEYSEIDYYYSLYESMLQRMGLEDMKATSEGLYVSMQILRKFMGGFSLTKTKLVYPEVTVSMLNDLARYAIQLDQHDNAWQLSVKAYQIGVAYGKEESARQSFLMLYKISASVGDRFRPSLEKFAEHALKTFVKNGWDTSQITPILNETQGRYTQIQIPVTEEPMPFSQIPEELREWMDVLVMQQVDGRDILIVRNERLQARIGLVVTNQPAMRALKTGHKIALTHGHFRLSNATPDMIKNYAVVLIIEPAEDAQISYQGEYGFRGLKFIRPENQENDKSIRQ